MNVLFDLDGTLTDPRQGIVACIRHALVTLRQPVPSDDVLATYIGPPLRDAFRSLLPPASAVERIESAIAAYRERFVARGMFENSVYEGIPEVLQELSARGARLFVATSKPRVYAERILDHFGLSTYFETVYGSELDGRLSDKGELIAHALTASALDPAATVMVGDRLHDIVGARRNRVYAAGALWGYGSASELEDAGARVLLRVPRDVASLIDAEQPATGS
jgi:phosphoglycolate phosphatase